MDHFDTNSVANEHAMPRGPLFCSIMGSPVISSIVKAAIPCSVRGYLQENLLLKCGPKPLIAKGLESFLTGFSSLILERLKGFLGLTYLSCRGSGRDGKS